MRIQSLHTAAAINLKRLAAAFLALIRTSLWLQTRTPPV
jgi:hypothetical protein